MFGVEERPPEPIVERFDPIDGAIGVVTAPVLAMKTIALARPWPTGLGIYVALGVLGGFANLTGARQNRALTDPNTPAALRDFVGFIYSPAGVLVNALVFAPLLLTIGTGIFYLVARLLGGQGAFSGLFSTQAFASSCWRRSRWCSTSSRCRWSVRCSASASASGRWS